MHELSRFQLGTSKGHSERSGFSNQVVVGSIVWFGGSGQSLFFLISPVLAHRLRISKKPPIGVGGFLLLAREATDGFGRRCGRCRRRRATARAARKVPSCGWLRSPKLLKVVLKGASLVLPNGGQFKKSPVLQYRRVFWKSPSAATGGFPFLRAKITVEPGRPKQGDFGRRTAT